MARAACRNSLAAWDWKSPIQRSRYLRNLTRITGDTAQEPSPSSTKLGVVTASRSPPMLWCSSLGTLHVKCPFTSFPFLSFLFPCWARWDENRWTMTQWSWSCLHPKSSVMAEKAPTFTINPNIAIGSSATQICALQEDQENIGK